MRSGLGRIAQLVQRLALAWLSCLAGFAALPQLSSAQVADRCNATSATCPAHGWPSIKVWTTEPTDSAKHSSVKVFVAAHSDFGLNLGSYSVTFSSGASDAGATLGSLAWSSASRTDAAATSTVSLTGGDNWIAVEVQDNDGQTVVDTLRINLGGIRFSAISPSRMGPRVDSMVLAKGIRDLSANSFESTLSYSTPAYVSRNTPRSVGLIYHAASAVVTVPVQFEVTDPSPSPAATLSLQIVVPGGGPETFYNAYGSTELYYTGGSGTIRMAGVVDAHNYATGSYPRNAVITARWNDTTITRTVPIQMMVVNDQASPVGAGWSIAGLSKLVVQSSDAFVLSNGSGGLSRFGWCSAPCRATNPPGVFDSLSVPSGTGSDTLYFLTTLRGDTIGYNPAGRQVFTKDRWGNTTTFSYSSGLLSTIVDPAGKTTTFGYTSSLLSTITDPSGRVSNVTVNGSNDLTSVEDPDGKWALHNLTYSSHQLTQWDDRAGGTWNATYGPDNTLSQIQAPTVAVEGGTTRPTTKFAGPHSSLLAPAASGGTSGAPLSRLSPDSASGMITAPDSTVTRVWPTDLGVAARVEAKAAAGAEKSVETTDYNAAWQPVRATSFANGVPTSVVENTYDGAKLKVVKDGSSGAETKYFYSTVGGLPVVDSLKANGTVMQRNFFSASGSPTRLDSTRTDTLTTRFTYDSYGRLLSTTNPEGHVTAIRYQSGGFQNTDSVTSPGGRTVHYSYDSKGRVASVTNPLGQTTATSYDLMNRPDTVTQPNTIRTRFKYDDAALRDTVIDANGQKYTTTRNVLGWVTSRVDPRGNSEAYIYDRRGSVTRFTNRSGDSITTRYDTLGRVKFRAAGGDTTTFAYDTGAKWVSASNVESADTVFLDPAGRSSHAVSWRAGYRFAVGSSYGADGTRNQIFLMKSDTVATSHFGYDGIKRLNRIQNARGLSGVLTYTRFGQLNTLTIPTTTNPATAMKRQDSYNSRDERWTTNYTVSTATDNYLGRAYGRDSLGRILETQYFGMGSGGYDTAYREYQYDALGRVTHYLDWTFYQAGWYWDCPNGGGYDECQVVWPDPVVDTLRSASYTYDDVGNRTDHSASTATGNRFEYFNGFTMTYDSTGNMLTKNGSGVSDTLTWNPLGQLTQVRHNGVTTTFGYDGWGRRVRKTHNGTMSRFIYDGDHLVQETDQYGTAIRTYTYLPGMDQPYSIVQSGHSYFYGLEDPGQVAGLTDSTGTMVSLYNYDPFGTIVASTNGITQPLKFMGRELDESGYYFVRARYYDPALARFISEDPIGLAGGINPYVYSGNDPVNNRDPYGLCSPKPCVDQLPTVYVDSNDEDQYGNGSRASWLFNFWQQSQVTRTRIQGDVQQLPTVHVRGRAGNAIEAVGARLQLSTIEPIVDKAWFVLSIFTPSGGGERGIKFADRALGHVFRDQVGHVLPATLSSQGRYVSLFEHVANNGLRNDHILSRGGIAAGKQGFTMAFKRGQVWVEVIGGEITNAGVNRVGFYR